MDLSEFVEGKDGISVTRGSENCRGWNGIHYKVGMPSRNVGSKKRSMNVATIPPGGVAAAYVHVGFELMTRSLASPGAHCEDLDPELGSSTRGIRDRQGVLERGRATWAIHS
jgi:hypothetical protein